MPRIIESRVRGFTGSESVVGSLLAVILSIASLLVPAAVTACGAPPADASGKTGGGLYWEATGSGDPVVLVHAFSLDCRMWDAQVAALKGKHRVILFDQRGQGLSPGPEAPFATWDDLLEVLDAAGVGKAALIGLSSGAQIATDFTLLHPDRVSALVLASPGLSGYVPKGSFEWMNPVIEKIKAGDIEGGAAAWADTQLMKIPGNPEADARMRDIVMDNKGIWTYSQSMQKTLSPPALRRLNAIRVPTLIITGALDLPDTQEIAGILESGIRDARRVTIPGAGHLVNMAKPAEFNEEIVAFLGR